MTVSASMVFSTSPMLSVIESRKVWWASLNAEKDASSTTARRTPSNMTGKTMMLSGGDSPSPELILT